MTGHTGRIYDLDVSPDDSLLVSASADTTVKVWNTETGKELYNYVGNNEDSNSVAFSPDGKKVSTASSDETTKEFTIDYDTLLAIAQDYELRPLTMEECQRFLYRDNCALTLFGGTASNNEVSSSPVVQVARPWHDLLRALQALGIPRPFLMVLSVAWRYLFVLVVAVEEMCMARKSRGIDESRLCAASGSAAQGQGWAASRMGALFRKTRMLGEEVSNAMLSRGFRGEARSLSRFRLRWSDVAWCAGCLSIAVLVACDLISLP